MPTQSNKSENIKIEELLEENSKLKQLLKLKNIDYDDNLAVKVPSLSDHFVNARLITKVAYWHYSFDTNHLESSEEAYKILEFSDSDIIDTNKIIERIHPDSRKSFISEFAKNLKTEKFFTIETRMVVPDGSIKYVSIKVIIEHDENARPISISGTISDETENHYHINNLKDNEKLFRSLFNNITDIFIIFEVFKDHDNNIVDYIYKDVNPTFEMKMGLTKAEVIDKKLSLKPAFFQQLNPLFQLSIIAQQPQQDRIYFQSLDSFFDILIYSPSENTIATIWRDVTLMVESDSSLRESEEKYRQIFSIGSDSLFMFDFLSGRILDVNPTGCKLFGYSKESLVKMVFYQLSATPDKLNEEIQNQKKLLHNYAAVKSNNTEFPVEISLSYFNWSGRKVSVASIRDISERILVQEKLIKSEQKFKQLFDYSNDAILIIKNYRIIDFNQKSISLFKLPPEELLNKTLWNISPSKQIGGDESRNKAVENIQNSLLGNQLQFEWLFQNPDRTIFTADIKLSPIVVGNEKVVQVIVRDISPQKETQKALITKEERWKASLQIGSIGVWEYNHTTGEVYFSEVLKNIIGFEKNELQNKIEELYNRIHPDELEIFKKEFSNHLAKKTPQFQINFRIRCKNGTYKWLHTQGKTYLPTKELVAERFIATIEDITKQKIYEEKLNSEILNLTFSNNISQLGYWELDIRTMVISGQRNTFAILGFNDTEQISLRQLEKIIHPEDQKNFIAQFVSGTNQTILENLFRIIVNNTTKYIILRSRPVRNTKNILTGFRGTFQDVTSLKQESNTVNDERILFNTIVEGLQCSIMIVKENQVLYSNSRTTELTGYSQKDLTSKNIIPFNLTIPEDQINIRKMIDSILLNPTQTEKTEVRIETKNNRIKWVETSLSLIDIKNENCFLYLMYDISLRKKNELELLESEKLFKSVLTDSNIGISIISVNSEFIFSNESFHLLSGLSHSDIKNKTFDVLFNENDKIKIRKGVEALTLSIARNFECEVSQFGGNKSWFKLNIIPVKKDKKEIDHFIFFAENVDDEKKKITQLEEGNELGITLKDNSPFGFAHFNNKFELINSNNRFSVDFKQPSKSKSKITLFDIDKLALHQNPIINISQNENIAYTFEIFSDQEKYLNVDIIPITHENEKSYLLYSIDITKSKKRIDALTHEADRFRGIFDNSPLGIVLIDKNRNIIISNHEFERFFGFKQNELNFIKIDSLIDSQHLGECISKFSQLFTGINNSFKQVLKMNSRVAESRWINANAASIKDSFGDSKYAIFVIEDISQLKNDENVLITNERLQTLNYVANSFAHQFNNILMGIYGNSYMLNTHLKDVHLSKFSNEILSLTNKATEISHKLLSFSGKNNSLNILFSCDELVNDVIKSLIINPKIQFNKILTHKNGHIFGDPFQLRNVIQYIINNAIESMPNGGNLLFETSIVFFEPDTKSDSMNTEKGKYLRLIISDTGLGMTPNELTRIFDPFYTTKTSSDNIGIGLSIVKQIISTHQGTIKVYSTKDKGTSFNIYLPIREVTKKNLIVQPDERILVKGSAKILLIDDEDIVRFITTELLGELGFDVYSFGSGKKALKFYSENYAKIDLVILDKHMPEMDGVLVFNNLKLINEDVKVLILTGYNIDPNLQNMFSGNPDGFIQKPVSIEKLSRSISEVLYL